MIKLYIYITIYNQKKKKKKDICITIETLSYFIRIAVHQFVDNLVKQNPFQSNQCNDLW